MWKTTDNLQSPVFTLYRAFGQSTGRPTAAQQAQMQFIKAELESKEGRAQ